MQPHPQQHHLEQHRPCSIYSITLQSTEPIFKQPRIDTSQSNSIQNNNTFIIIAVMPTMFVIKKNYTKYRLRVLFENRARLEAVLLSFASIHMFEVHRILNCSDEQWAMQCRSFRFAFSVMMPICPCFQWRCSVPAVSLWGKCPMVNYTTPEKPPRSPPFILSPKS